jgi:hypothetical protein
MRRTITSTKIIAFAEINKIVIAILEVSKHLPGLSMSFGEVYYVSIFKDIESAKDYNKPKFTPLKYDKATKRFAKLCKAAHTMNFKTTK